MMMGDWEGKNAMMIMGRRECYGVGRERVQ